MRNYRKTDRKTRLSIATDDSTSADLLTQLATDEDAEIRQAVASNPNTPQDVLLMLGKEFPEAIIANPIFTISLLENPESQFYRLSLARSSTTLGEILANLAQLPDQEILCAIAQNPNTPVATLEELVENPPQIYNYEDSDGEEFEHLLTCIAKNPNTPESILLKVAKNYSSSVQYAIAENPNAPIAILNKFADCHNSTLHQALIRNPNTPTAILEKLAGEQSQETRNLVKAHPNVSEMAIAIVEFVKDRYGTPIYLLEKLATHSSPYVRRLVAERRDTPSHVLELLSLYTDDDYIPTIVAGHRNASATAIEQAVESLATTLWKPNGQHPLRDRYSREAQIKYLIERDNITAKTFKMLFSLAEPNSTLR